MSPVTGENHITTDVLVIGGGIAGFFAAMRAKEQGLDVTLTDKGYIGRTGSTHFQGGDILLFRPEQGHLEEVVNLISKKGEYLSNREWTEICLKESQDRYNDLVSWGTPLEKQDEQPVMRKGYGLERNDIYNITGLIPREYTPSFRRAALKSGIRVLDRIMFCELLKQDGKVVGAVGFHTKSSELYIFTAKATVIATGSTNLKSGTHMSYYWSGDGEAMAYRAGADISGLEFAYGIYSGFLGGPKRNDIKRRRESSQGTGITGKINDIMTRQPFARVPGAAWAAPNLNAEGGPVIDPAWEAHCGRAPVYMDPENMASEEVESIQEQMTRKGMWVNNKPILDTSSIGTVQSSGAAIITSSVPGGAGIWPIDDSCATGVPGLYSAGNSCATMGAGTMYPAMGFGLNHAAVTGNRAGLGAAEYASKSKEIKIDEGELKRVKTITCLPMERKGGFTPDWVTQVLHGYSIPYFFLQIKHKDRLQPSLKLVEFLNNHLVPKLIAKNPHQWRMAHETKNMALIVEIMLRSSLFRTESRGPHFREDYPYRDDPAWLAWIKVKEAQGKMKVYKQPVPKKWWPDLTRTYEERYPTMLPGEEV